MGADGWADLKELFAEAIDVPVADREAWLAVRCAGDDDLRTELETLLASHDRPHRIFARSHLAVPPFDVGDQHRLPPGYRIGPYCIARHLGQGGMGSVYQATRSDGAFTKDVAIKLVHSGVKSADVLARFWSERQMLASLAHANIATLLDGGTTEDGHPYFVMEYVAGVPIDAHCDRHEVSLDGRLQLFLRVCAAVEHAHQHLIVHRDLKPDNVLVREDGEVKLLDFGIGKILESAPLSAHTVAGARPMTLRYASPEQVRGEAISTSTDLYSLAVLLYQLLTGRLPYATGDASGRDIERAICDEQPRRPSEAGREDPAVGWHHRLTGDLDAIILMALRKEPERRYRNVAQFADDIRRYRDGLPIVARPDTLGYRVGKFVGRNRLAAAAAAAAAIALVAGIAATTWVARVARRQAAVAVAEREKAQVEAVRVQRLNEFLTNVLALPDSSWYAAGAGSPRDMTVVDLLKQAGQRIDVELRTHPDLAADLHHTLGNTYRSRGFTEESREHFAAALALRQQVYGPRHRKVSESLYFLGAAEHWLGRQSRFMDLLQQAIAIERELPVEEATNLPYMLSDYSGGLRERGDLTGSERYLREALQLLERRHGTNDIRTAFVHEALGLVLLDRGDLAGARRLLEGALSVLQAANVREVNGVLSNLSTLENADGHPDVAERLIRRAIDRASDGKNSDDAAIGAYFVQLSTYLRQQGRHDEAIQAAERALAGLPAGPAPSRQRRADALLARGVALAAAGRPAPGERDMRESIALLARLDGLQCTLGRHEAGLVVWLRGRGRAAEAETLRQRAIAHLNGGCSHESRGHRDQLAALQ